MSSSIRPHQRLNLFLDLVGEYRALSEAFPGTQTFVFGAARPAAERWNHLVRSFALRKFTLAKSDDVYVGTVLDALAAMVPALAQDTEHWKSELEGVVNGGAAYGDPSTGDMLNADDVIRDVLYGAFLHGDYEKWKRAQPRVGLIEDMAMWTWSSGSEHYVYRLEQWIRALANQRVLDLDDPPAG